MKKKLKKALFISLILLTVVVLTGLAVSAEYTKITGDLNLGNKFIDSPSGDYDLWIKYERKLENNNHYFIKGTINNNIKYETEDNYSDIVFQGKYDYIISKKTDTYIDLTIKNQNHYNLSVDNIKNYNQIKIKLDLGYDINEKNSLNLHGEKWWKIYNNKIEGNQLIHKINLKWKRNISEKLTFTADTDFKDTRHPENSTKNSFESALGIKLVWKM